MADSIFDAQPKEKNSVHTTISRWKLKEKNAIHFNNKTNVALFVMLVIKVSLEKSARLSSFVRLAHECFQNEIGR